MFTPPFDALPGEPFETTQELEKIEAGLREASTTRKGVLEAQLRKLDERLAALQEEQRQLVGRGL